MDKKAQGFGVAEVEIGFDIRSPPMGPPPDTRYTTPWGDPQEDVTGTPAGRNRQYPRHVIHIRAHPGETLPPPRRPFEGLPEGVSHCINSSAGGSLGSGSSNTDGG